MTERPTNKRPLTAQVRKTCLALVAWMPVAIPLALFAQVALLGLRPALAEKARLALEEERMLERLTKAKQTHEEYEIALRAFADPIYRERERKNLGLPPEVAPATPTSEDIAAAGVPCSE